MINALLLILSPVPTYKRLNSAGRAPWFVLLVYFLPILLIGCSVEAWALMKYGVYERSVQRTQHISQELATRYATTHVITALLSTLISSALVFNIARGIRIRATFSQCFNTLTYALGPAYLLRFADSWDFLNTWIICGAAILLIFHVLYAGIPVMVKPDPAGAFGFYLSAGVVLSACYAASHLFSFLVLNETLFKKGLGLHVLGF